MPLTTAAVVNQANATTLEVTVSNDSAGVQTAELELFSVALSSTGVTKTGAAHQLFSIPALTVITRTFNITGFPAYELQANVSSGDVVVDTFASDAGGNLVAAERVLESETVFIPTLTPLP